jgi:general secretion pathway protein I
MVFEIAGHRRERGFTLLEVLVAVFILAIALATIISAGANYASSASELRDKTRALWVAHNRMTEVEMQTAWPGPGTSSDDVKLAGIEWTWHQSVIATPDPTVIRVNVTVEKKGDRNRRTYAELSGFISNVGRKTQ